MSAVSPIDATDTAARRALLGTEPNPAPRLDYLVALEAQIRTERTATPILVRLRYVPDRVLVVPRKFGDYVAAIGGGPWASLEQIGVTVLDDVNNEIVPRWVEVTVTEDAAAAGGIGTHRVRLEDRQPQWDNESLLARL